MKKLIFTIKEVFMLKKSWYMLMVIILMAYGAGPAMALSIGASINAGTGESKERLVKQAANRRRLITTIGHRLPPLQVHRLRFLLFIVPVW